MIQHSPLHQQVLPNHISKLLRNISLRETHMPAVSSKERRLHEIIDHKKCTVMSFARDLAKIVRIFCWSVICCLESLY